MTDLSDLLPEGFQGAKRQKTKVSLSEFLAPQGPPPEPETFSGPLALELHLCRTFCRCGEVFIVPEGAFVEVTVKKLMTVGLNHYYKEIGSVLLPVQAERSEALAKVSHRTRWREAHTVVCQHCLDRSDLYRDAKPSSHHEWEVSRPQRYTQVWLQYQMEAAPSRGRLLELIEQIERREARMDDEKFQPGKVGAVFNKLMNPLVDPEESA